MSNVIQLSADKVQELLAFKPELRDEFVSAIDAKIEEYQGLRVAITSGGPVVSSRPGLKKAKRRGRPTGKKTKTNGTTKRVVKKETDESNGSEASTEGRMKHKDAILQVLNSNEWKDVGAMSRDIRKSAEEFGHDFGKSLGTTLNLMAKKDLIRTEDSGKSKKHPQYKYFSA